MDPVSPPRSARAGTPRRRHATASASDGPAATTATAVVDPADTGESYDGRNRRRPSSAGTTRVVPGSSGIDRRTPVRPGRKGSTAAATARGRARSAAPATVPSTLTARRVGVGVLVGAFLMLMVATVDSFAGANMPLLGSFAAPGSDEADEPPPAPPPPDTAGVCLSWKRPDAADTAAVDCARPHLFEQAGNVKLLDQPTFPNDAAWQKLVADRCTPLVTGYLKNKFDPDGRFRIGALKPSQQRWDGGDKGMRCGLQTASRSGKLFPITGTVATQDQSAVVAPGICLGIDGRTISDPVNCGQPHAVETVGVIDLGPQFKDRMPSVDEQDGFLQPACIQASTVYAGNDQVIAQKKLTVYWDNLSEASWNAGSRKVNCNLATLLPDGSGFAAITGSVRGALTVAGEPAPAAGAPSAPGAPATPGGQQQPPNNATPGTPTGGTPAPSGSGTPQQPTPPPNVPPGLPGLAP